MERGLVAVADACRLRPLPDLALPPSASCQIPVPALEQNLKGRRRYQHCGECHQPSWGPAPPMGRLAADVSTWFREEFDSPQRPSLPPVVPQAQPRSEQQPQHAARASSPGLVLEQSLEESRQNLRGKLAGPWYPPGDPA